MKRGAIQTGIVILGLLLIVSAFSVLKYATQGDITGQAGGILSFGNGSYVYRWFPDSDVVAGANVTVYLNVSIDPAYNETFYAIDENITSGFTLVDPGDGDNTQTGHLKWLYFDMNNPGRIDIASLSIVFANCLGID